MDFESSSPSFYFFGVFGCSHRLSPENAPEVPHDMTVNEVIKISRTTEVPIRVLQDGKPVGIITSNDILDNLAK